MQQSRWERLAPLSGVLSVAIIVAVFAIGGSTPEEHDSAAKVQAFYSKHHDKHAALAFIIAIVAFTPAGFFAFLAGGLWILIASILLTLARRAAHTAPPSPAGGQTAAG